MINRFLIDLSWYSGYTNKYVEGSIFHFGPIVLCLDILGRLGPLQKFFTPCHGIARTQTALQRCRDAREGART